MNTLEGCRVNNINSLSHHGWHPRGIRGISAEVIDVVQPPRGQLQQDHSSRGGPPAGSSGYHDRLMEKNRLSPLLHQLSLRENAFSSELEPF